MRSRHRLYKSICAGVQDYVVFFALTADTNINSLQAAAASGLQYPNSSYYNAPTDCQYANQTSDVAAAASNNDAGCAPLASWPYNF